MNRRNGTSARSRPLHASPALVTYREIAPSPELREHVRAFFSFVPGSAPWQGRHALIREVQFAIGDSFCSPLFADGRTSLVLDLGATCHLHTGWAYGTPLQARVIGALRTVGAPASNSHAEMIGAYFEPDATSALLQVPAVKFTDSIVRLDDLWGTSGARLAEDLAALDEATRVVHLENALLQRMRRAAPARLRLDVAGIARWARTNSTTATVDHLAAAAGVSRQHLTRVFREIVGISPKRYCRLARFQAGLIHAGCGAGVKWAQVAAELGYADQSHMIAEFRELSGLTPEALATGEWFHPFILEAKSRPTAARSSSAPPWASRRSS